MRHADTVLLLSRVTGREVVGPDRRGVGRLSDLTVRVDDDGARADMASDGNILYVYGNSGELVAYEITAKE